MPLTKTQIKYFVERLSTVAMRVKSVVEKDFPKPDSMTPQEKLVLIASGKAELKFEFIEGKIRVDRYIHLFDAFDFPGACERDAARKDAEERIARAFAAVERTREDSAYDFVLGRVENPDEVLREFENRAPEFIAAALAS